MFDEYNKLYKVFEENGRLEKENEELKKLLEEKDKVIEKLNYTLKVRDRQLSSERGKWDKYWRNV